MLTASTGQSRSRVRRRARRQVAADDHDVRAAPSLVGGAVRRRHRAFLVHGLSVTIGHFLGLTLPERPIAFAAAIAFLLFAAVDVARGPQTTTRTASPRSPNRATCCWRSSRRSCSPNSATRRCSPPSRWPATTTGPGSGSARPSGMVLADGVAIAVGRAAAQAAARALAAQDGQRAVPAVRGVAALRQRTGVAIGRDRRHGLVPAAVAVAVGGRSRRLRRRRVGAHGCTAGTVARATRSAAGNAGSSREPRIRREGLRGGTNCSKRQDPPPGQA